MTNPTQTSFFDSDEVEDDDDGLPKSNARFGFGDCIFSEFINLNKENAGNQFQDPDINSLGYGGW